MARFTKALRQQIVDDFARIHNGIFNPQLFVAHVKKKGEAHPAYSWFEWDDNQAAHEFRVWQARTFVHDLRITFEIESVGRSGTMTVRSTSMPMVVSPVGGRRDGGGYVVSDPDNAEHMAELCRQAGGALYAWLDRYEAALLHIGNSPSAIERIAKALEAMGVVAEVEAA